MVKSFKNLKLHLTKKPACKNVFDFSSIEAESDLRIKTQQTVYKEKNRSQINVKRKSTRSLSVTRLQSITAQIRRKLERTTKYTTVKIKTRCKQDKKNTTVKIKTTCEQDKKNTIVKIKTRCEPDKRNTTVRKTEKTRK